MVCVVEVVEGTGMVEVSTLVDVGVASVEVAATFVALEDVAAALVDVVAAFVDVVTAFVVEASLVVVAASVDEITGDGATLTTAAVDDATTEDRIEETDADAEAVLLRATQRLRSDLFATTGATGTGEATRAAMAWWVCAFRGAWGVTSAEVDAVRESAKTRYVVNMVVKGCGCGCGEVLGWDLGGTWV